MSLEMEKEYRGYLDEFNNVIATQGVDKPLKPKIVLIGVFPNYK